MVQEIGVAVIVLVGEDRLEVQPVHFGHNGFYFRFEIGAERLVVEFGQFAGVGQAASQRLPLRDGLPQLGKFTHRGAGRVGVVPKIRRGRQGL